MTTATAHQVVTFRIGDDYFAADILTVERVLRYAKPTVVPNLPPWIEGVLEYQGRVIPVIDLRRRFGLEPHERRDGRIIVFAAGDDWVGALVDAVLEVIALGADDVAPPPSLFRGLAAEYLRGLVRRGERMLIYLEVPRLLTSTEHLELRHSVDGVRADG